MARYLTALCALALTATLAACSEGEAPEAVAEAGTADASDAPSPEPAPFYVGQWAADPVWCTDQTDGFPIIITEARFEGRENICEMADIETTPEGGATARLTCQSEGETIEEPITFAQAGDQIAIVWPDRGTEATLFSRCE
ncbi:hypothetical protein [Pelagibacterium halotolerans]|nr:hypothetical protein [Pelagibacterium halotolerans]QJR18381.1 hypothetical protein HKM20_08015 [Pelagibacterium halotolerans]SEA24045.1 hypothetical protein SAMN05428936_102431 [Pelagibacterium halotolerans]